MNRHRIHLAIALIIAACCAAFAVNLGDFVCFYDAAIALRSGYSPYAVSSFLSPLIVLVYFLPLSFLPLDIAFRLNAFVCLFVYVVVFWRIAQGRLFTFWLLLLTPFALFSAYFGNIEWMPLLGAITNPILGVWLAVTKPQMGIVLCGVLLLEVYRLRGMRFAFWLGASIAAMLIASYAAGMLWQSVIAAPWNISAWPYGVAIGASLVMVSVKRLNRLSALAAAPLISPYLNPGSWVAVLPLLSRRHVLLVLAVIASWLMLLHWRSWF